MKVERPYLEACELQNVGGSAPANQANQSSAAFETSLRRHREQDASRREGQRRSDAASSGRAAPRTAVTGQRTAARLLDTMMDASGCLMEGGRAAQSRGTLTDAAPSLAAALASELRRRRAPELDSSPCIEVEHSGTGVRLLLSRENGVWLVSLRPESSESAVDQGLILDSLRAYFVEQGLGPIDVISR
jgi:hypothetical protein